MKFNLKSYSLLIELVLFVNIFHFYFTNLTISSTYSENTQGYDSDTLFIEDFESYSVNSNPDQWIIVNEYERSYCNIEVKNNVSGVNPFGSQFLIISDAQDRLNTEAVRNMGISTKRGNFSFEIWKNNNTFTDAYHEIILENGNGEDIISFAAVTTNQFEWHMELQEKSAEINYVYRCPRMRVSILFNNKMAELIVDSKSVLTEISYETNMITQIRLKSGITGLGSIVAYDNFILDKWGTETISGYSAPAILCCVLIIVVNFVRKNYINKYKVNCVN